VRGRLQPSLSLVTKMEKINLDGPSHLSSPPSALNAPIVSAFSSASAMLRYFLPPMSPEERLPEDMPEKDLPKEEKLPEEEIRMDAIVANMVTCD
jgi:hypothetical protein